MAKKSINKNLAEICEYAYKRGFKDALYLADKCGLEPIKKYGDEILENGIKKAEKEWKKV